MGQTETWQHRPETWREMWEQVGAETGQKWESEAEVRSFEECGGTSEGTAWLGEGAGYMFFMCRRVA